MADRELYDRIRAESAGAIASGEVEVDPFLSGAAVDRRLGLSLVLPLLGLREGFCRLVAAFQSVDPRQYYYPYGDAHVTVLDFAAADEAYPGFLTRKIGPISRSDRRRTKSSGAKRSVRSGACFVHVSTEARERRRERPDFPGRRAFTV